MRIQAFSGWLALTLILLYPLAQASKIYKWVDKEGNVHYTESPPDTVQYRQIKLRSHDGHQGEVSNSTQDKNVGNEQGINLSKPVKEECNTVICQANRMETDRLKLEHERQIARDRLENPQRYETPTQRAARLNREQKIAQDRNFVAKCEQYERVGFEHYTHMAPVAPAVGPNDPTYIQQHKLYDNIQLPANFDDCRLNLDKIRKRLKEEEGDQ